MMFNFIYLIFSYRGLVFDQISFYLKPLDCFLQGKASQLELPSGQNGQKSSLCIFDNMALYFECRRLSGSVLQTVFLAILPTE